MAVNKNMDNNKPLFVALRELMKAKLYDSVTKVIDTALLDNIPLEDIEEIKKSQTRK